jgi:hypothetical protein
VVQFGSLRRACIVQVLLEPAAGQFQKLRRRLQIDLGADDVLVAEIGRQQGQLGVDIDSLVCPSREPMNGKGMTELVRPRTDTSAGGLEAKLTQLPADRIRCRPDRQR